MSASLYETVKDSSGGARLDALDALRTSLLRGPADEGDLLLGLSLQSNDIRRVVLEAVSSGSDSAEYSRAFLKPVLAIVKQNLQAPASSVSAIRTSSAALKALSSLLKGKAISPLTSTEVQDIIDVVLQTLSWGLSVPLMAAPRPQFVRPSGPGSAFSFDRSGVAPSQRRDPIGQSTSGPLRKKSSSSSLRSFASMSVEGTDQSDAASEDDEGGTEERQRRLGEAKRGARYRSIACLSSLHERAGRLLLVQWPRLLVDVRASKGKAASLMDVAERDDDLSNRIRALHVIQSIIMSGSHAGFMAGAEERSRLSAFTSLSSMIATVIIDLRKRLVLFLQEGNNPTSLLEAALKCSRTLVSTTAQVKLHASHAQVLRPTVLQLCSHKDVAIAVPAYSLLSSLMTSDGGHADSMSSSGVIATLQDARKPLQVQEEAWNTLTACASKGALTEQDKREMAVLLPSTLRPMSAVELRQAAARYAVACAAKDSTLIDLAVLRLLTSDPSAVVRSLAADCLAVHPTFTEILLPLFDDEDSTVRASAIRALGIKIQAESKGYFADHVARLLLDESLLVRMRASWTLGNLSEHSEDYDCMLKLCYSVHSDDERVTVNAVRGVGAILSRFPADQLASSTQLIRDVLAWLESTLLKAAPKVRWNAAACMARAMTSTSVSYLLITLDDARLLSVLAAILVNDSSFKVRLSVAQALSALAGHGSAAYQDAKESLRAAVQQASSKTEVQMQEASFKEIQMHALPLRQSLERLSTTLQET